MHQSADETSGDAGRGYTGWERSPEKRNSKIGTQSFLEPSAGTQRTTNDSPVKVKSEKSKRHKAKEVFEGELCGLSLKTAKKLLLEEGDTVEFFTRELVKRSLK